MIGVIATTATLALSSTFDIMLIDIE